MLYMNVLRRKGDYLQSKKKYMIIPKVNAYLICGNEVLFFSMLPHICTHRELFTNRTFSLFSVYDVLCVYFNQKVAGNFGVMVSYLFRLKMFWLVTYAFKLFKFSE